MLFLLVFLSTPWCLALTIRPLPTATVQRSTNDIDKREESVTQLSTCGYLNGDPSKPRTADHGYNCRVDAANAVWGFCETTVFSAGDCGFPGVCVDKARCNEGCGVKDKGLGTFTCTGRDNLCSFAFLSVGIDQTYTYAACGTTNIVETYFALPTVEASATNETPQVTSSTKESKSETATQVASTNSPNSPTASSSSSSATSLTPSTTSSPASSSSNVDTISEPTQRGTDTNPAQLSDNKPAMIGAIIGGVIGGLALICLSVVATIYLLRRNRAEQLPPAYSDKPPSRKSRVKSFIWAPPQELPSTPRRIQSRYELQG